VVDWLPRCLGQQFVVCAKLGFDLWILPFVSRLPGQR
jgi:hypothetical protein